MPNKSTTKTQISVTHPKGVSLTDEVLSKAAAAAQIVVDELAATASLQSVLAAHGISVSVEQILALKSGVAPKATAAAASKAAPAPNKKAAKKSRPAQKAVVAPASAATPAPAAAPAPKKKAAKKQAAKKGRKGKRGGSRTPVSPETRAAITESLKNNEGPVAKLCAKYGVSSTTVNLIKKSLGLVKSRKD